MNNDFCGMQTQIRGMIRGQRNEENELIDTNQTQKETKTKRLVIFFGLCESEGSGTEAIALTPDMVTDKNIRREIKIQLTLK